MEKIVCDIKLGIKQQNVYIIGEKYSNKKTIESFMIPFDKISDFIIQHNITNITLKGPKIFTQKIEEETKEKELKKYSKTKTIFTYIQGE